jgi:hypothetical protein
MFEDFLDYPWVLKPLRYDNVQQLLNVLKQKIIEPLNIKVGEMEKKRKQIEREFEEE